MASSGYTYLQDPQHVSKVNHMTTARTVLLQATDLVRHYYL